MNRLILSLAIVFQSLTVLAQTQTDIPKLNKLLTTLPDDTSKVHLLIDHAIAYRSKVDSSLLYANRALSLSYKIRYEIGVIKSLNEIGINYINRGSYEKAQNAFFEVVKKSEKITYKRGAGAAYANIANVYLISDDPQLALLYLYKAKPIFEKADFKNNLIGVYNEIGKAYLELNRIDSALIFCNLAYETAIKNKVEATLGGIELYLGQIHEKLGKNQLALTYYQMSANHFLRYKNNYDLCISYYLLSNYYSKNKEPDSTLFYGNKAFSIAQKSSSIQGIQYSSLLLFDYYKPLNNDSALKYLLTSINVKDKFFGSRVVKGIRDLESTEKQRQEKILKDKILKDKEWQHTIRILTIALVLTIILLILFVLRVIRLRSYFIKRIGIFVVLLLFELITLTAHRYVEEWTHGNPYIMLAILAFLAMMLAPLHHRIENWIRKSFDKRPLYSR